MAIIRAKNEADYTFKAGSYSGNKLRVIRFHGSEAISDLYRFSVDLASTDGEVDFDKVIGETAVLAIQGNKGPRHVHGMVNRFQQIGKQGKWTLYRAEVVPAVWALSQRHTCRIFQKLSVPDIIKKVLTDGGIPTDQFRFSLKRTYNPREYCVQYRESDLAFISRLMEQYGIFYFFEHAADKHVLVMGDDAVVHVPIVDPPKVIYRAPGTAGVADQEHVFEYHYSQAIRTDAVRLRDFDFKKPNLNLEQEVKAKVDDNLEAYDYPGEYEAPADGGVLAKVRLEELQTTRQTGAGRSDCSRFIPGWRFTLDQYSRSDFNREYLLIHTAHKGSQPQVLGAEAAGSAGETAYENRFRCIPSDVPFRPEKRTPQPIISGAQTAIVVGPAGEEVYTDPHGRVKVQFHWDREGGQNENSSCWVRVSQVWAGTGWGAMHIPRIGQEVIVEFLEGDPDRPIITGRVYHGTNNPPYQLPDEKTKSTIMSNTSPGGTTHNELLMEDKQGSTQVVLSNAYGHMITEDEATQSITIETRDKNIMVMDDKNQVISMTTTKAHSITLDDKNEKIAVKSTMGAFVELNDKDQKVQASTSSGHGLLFDDMNKKIELVSSAGHSVVVSDDQEKISITSKNGHYIALDDSGGSITLEDNAGSNRIKIDIDGQKLVLQTDAGDIDLEAPSGTITLNGMNVEIKAAASLKLSGGTSGEFDGGTQTTIKGVQTSVEGAAMAEVKGAMVKIN